MQAIETFQQLGHARYPDKSTPVLHNKAPHLFQSKICQPLRLSSYILVFLKDLWLISRLTKPTHLLIGNKSISENGKFGAVILLR